MRMANNIQDLWEAVKTVASNVKIEITKKLMKSMAKKTDVRECQRGYINISNNKIIYSGIYDIALINYIFLWFISFYNIHE